MKEKDVRERIENFLRSMVRTVVVPASMGLGLTLVGCSGSSSESRVDAAADAPVRMDASGRDHYPIEYTARYPLDGYPIEYTARYPLDGYPVEYTARYPLDTRPIDHPNPTNFDARPDGARDSAAAERWETQPSDARDVARQDAAVDAPVDWVTSDGAVDDGADGN